MATSKNSPMIAPPTAKMIGTSSPGPGRTFGQDMIANSLPTAAPTSSQQPSGPSPFDGCLGKQLADAVKFGFFFRREAALGSAVDLLKIKENVAIPALAEEPQQTGR